MLLQSFIPLYMTEREKQIIVGTVLGDSSIRRGKTDKYNFLTCQHGPNQKEYCEWKAGQLGQVSLKTTCKEYTRLTPNKKTGKIYSIVAMRVRNSPQLDYFRDIFYVDNKKVITDEVLQYYTPLAMAVHFMDDGSTNKGSRSGIRSAGNCMIATCGFDKGSITRFRDYLLSEYGVETTHTKEDKVLVRMSSKSQFLELITPYIIESMQYKVS